MAVAHAKTAKARDHNLVHTRVVCKRRLAEERTVAVFMLPGALLH